MMKHIQMGMPVGLLKTKLVLNQTIKPATEGAISSARNNHIKESLTLLEKGFSANPTKMAETLAESIIKLPKNIQESVFANFQNMPKNRTLVGLVENIQSKISGVKGISQQSLDLSMKKLFIIAKENGLNLNQLVKR